MKQRNPDAVSTACREDERGTVLVIVLVLMLGFAGFAQASLAKAAAEQRKAAKRFLARQVLAEADGQLELAKNAVNAASYTSLSNDALTAALNDQDNFLPGTLVRVEQIPGTTYYALRTIAERNGITKSAEAVVREVSPASAFNLFVIDHPVGVSGSPRGAIHSNRTVDFFFPGGEFRDSVTAAEGFNFRAGAAAGNTTFLGEVNGAAPKTNLLEDVDFAALEAEADVLAVTGDDLITEIEFDGAYGTAKIYKKRHKAVVEKTRTVQELVGYDYEAYVETVPVYETESYEYEHDVWVDVPYEESYEEKVYGYRDVTKTVTEPVYEERTVEYEVEVPVMGTVTKTREVEKNVWVSYEGIDVRATSSGGTVGMDADSDGFWRTVTVTETYDEEVQVGTRTEYRSRKENVKVGEVTRNITVSERYETGTVTKTRTRTRSEYSHTETRTGTREVQVGTENVVKIRAVPVYEERIETYEDTEWVDEELLRTETFAVDGTIFVEGDVRKIGGKIGGRLSLISTDDIFITDNLQYVDSDGDTRMLNGLNPDEPYTENPDYDGDSLLALIAADDVKYSRSVPDELEVNASLMAAGGSVKFEGLRVSDDGDSISTWGSKATKKSLRRLGGIVSYERPVASYIDEFGWIGAGFESGESIMDQNLLLSSGNNAPPPFTFETPRPTWVLSTSGSRLGAID